MPLVKSAVKFKLFSTLFFVVTLTVWIAFVCFTALFIKDTSVIKIVSAISFVIFSVIFAYVYLKKDKEFRCPDCKGEVDDCYETEGNGGEPLLRHCRKCDVLWHIGDAPSIG
jgi:hypothetical protein